MTSRSLCFKLMKEDLKRRVWTIALTILSLVFSLLVPTALRSSAYLERVAIGANNYDLRRAAQALARQVGVNGIVITILIVLSVVWAVSGFRYLHNSRMVDFYHSIPVKRSTLFLASYINGILIPAAVYVVVQVISVILVLRTGISAGVLGGTWWQICLLNILYYSMLYTTTVIAMMMTGNIIIALLGSAVFCGYGPAVITLIVGYKSTWFHTIWESARESACWLKILNYSSPFANYMFAIEDFSKELFGVSRGIGAIIVTVILAVIAYGIYRIRPSESAGKAMAFRKTQTPIKLLIAFPVAVAFGMFFYTLQSTLGWGIFGALCGSVITCCLMEIIYHFDFRKLFSHWPEMAVCGAVSVFLILAGRYDWYGYDSYLPKATSVKSAAVTLGYTEDWVTYGEPYESTNYRGDQCYTWDYESQAEYQQSHMELTDIYTVMELAKKGVEADKDYRARGNRDDYYTYESDQAYSWRFYIVQFHLNNGRTVTRRYRIPVDDEVKVLQTSIHDSGEYKKGTYPVLSQSAVDTAEVYFQQYDQLNHLNLDGEEKARLLAVYQKDLEELTMEVRERELPIGTIQFRTGKLDQAIAWNRNLEYGYESLEERCYYPVYPSFARTLEAIEETGNTVEVLNGDMISEVRVLYTAVYEGDDMTVEEAIRSQAAYDGQYVVYDKKEDIDSLCNAMVFQDYYNMNGFYEVDYADNVDVTAIFSSPRVSNIRNRDQMNFLIDLNRLSDEEIHRFGFLRYEEISSH